MAYPTEPAAMLGLWIGAILTIGLYSYMLYKETPFYRLVEHIYIGAAFGVRAVTAVKNTWRVAINPLFGGDILYLIPIALGIGMYTIFSRKYRWVSRYSVATLVATMLGVQIVAMLKPNIISQIISTITPPSGNALMSWFNFLFVALGVFAATSYFLLTHEHTGALAPITQIGRYLIMLGLGAMFGNTVLFRMSMLSGRIEYILQALGLIPM